MVRFTSSSLSVSYSLFQRTYVETGTFEDWKYIYLSPNVVRYCFFISIVIQIFIVVKWWGLTHSASLQWRAQGGGGWLYFCGIPYCDSVIISFIFRALFNVQLQHVSKQSEQPMTRTLEIAHRQKRTEWKQVYYSTLRH